MKVGLLVVLLGVIGAGAVPHHERAYTSHARCFAGQHLAGEWWDFNEANSHLGSINFDNTIESVRVTGMWLFYDYPEYNSNSEAYMCFVHGLEYSITLPNECSNMITSLRYAGSPYELNEDTWNVYDGEYFKGDTMFGTTDTPDLTYLDQRISSIIITGKSDWTFCTGLSYTGSCACLRPDTSHDHAIFQNLDLGIFPELFPFEFGDNAIQSVRRGCYGKVVSPALPLVTYTQEHNGGVGVLKLK